MKNVERLEERAKEDAHWTPQGVPIKYGFWDSPTLDELAQAQQVKPMTDIRALFGTWPGDKDDGFEEAIDALRHSGASACATRNSCGYQHRFLPDETGE